MLTGQNFWQIVVLLGFAAVAEQYRRQHAQTQGYQVRCAGPGTFLGKDMPLGDIPTCTAKFHRPVDTRPTSLMEDLLPGESNITVGKYGCCICCCLLDVIGQFRSQHGAHGISKHLLAGRQIDGHLLAHQRLSSALDAAGVNAGDNDFGLRCRYAARFEGAGPLNSARISAVTRNLHYR